MVTRLAVMAIMLIALLVFAADMELCLISVSSDTHLRLAYPWQEGGVVISPIREQDGLLKEGIFTYSGYPSFFNLAMSAAGMSCIACGINDTELFGRQGKSLHVRYVQ